MLSNHPKILHLSQRPFWCGESNRVLVICRGLHDRERPVTLGAPARAVLAHKAMAAGIETDTRFEFKGGCRPASILRDVLALRKLQRQRNFDIVHLHTSVDTWTAALAFGSRSGRERPILVRTRHSDHDAKRDIAHGWLHRRALDHLVLSSNALRQPIAGLLQRGALTEERLTVIHSSVDVKRFDPARVSGHAIRAELDLNNRFCIGLIGRLSPEKGHELLLAALPELIAREPRTCAIFAGEGPHEKSLRRAVAAGRIENHVRFAGFRSDIPQIMAAMDVIAVPSLRVESSPGTVKEGMAMGKPVVAAAVGGVEEIISHGVNGLVFKPGDIEALRKTLIHLALDPDARETLTAKSRATIMARFTDEHLIDNTIGLYDKLTGTQ